MPREIIDLAPGKRKKLTVMSYGPSRAGKTRFAGTWPRPLFLSDKSEGGYETLRYMKAEALYEPDRRPEVWPIGKAQEMVEAVQEVEQTIPKDPTRWRTLVIDSLTFYSDAYYAALEQAAYSRSGGKAVDKRHLFQDLGSHLRWLMIRVHELPLNVVWLCLEKPPGEGEEATAGGILLSGQTAQKAPARCDCLFYHRAYRAGADEFTYEIRTRRFGSFPAGGRDEGTLPDPIEPSYRVLESALQMEVPSFVKTREKKSA